MNWKQKRWKIISVKLLVPIVFGEPSNITRASNGCVSYMFFSLVLCCVGYKINFIHMVWMISCLRRKSIASRLGSYFFWAARRARSWAADMFKFNPELAAAAIVAMESGRVSEVGDAKGETDDREAGDWQNKQV